MKTVSSYKIKIKRYNHIFDETVSVYRKAVFWFLEVADQKWDLFRDLTGTDRNNLMERITLKTKRNPNPEFSFNEHFYKMPSYLRRAAIQEALGIYSSWTSSHENWLENPVGKEPKIQKIHRCMPALYRDNCFVRTGETSAKIKIFHRNDWIWLEVELRRQDVNYIKKYCSSLKESAPTLRKRGKNWYLEFAFMEEYSLNDISDIQNVRICAVDLGLNHHATCSVMEPDGTVTARKFIDFPVEKDHLDHALNRIRKACKNGSKKCPNKWAIVKNINTEISRKTAKAITDFAFENCCDIIVFEYLETKGRKRGSRRWRMKLHHWKNREIQKIAEHRAHLLGIHISRICAWNTSKLAFDGSGIAARDKDNYSICTFPSGKRYNCDLSASYNIGARYFIRELLKSESVRMRLPEQTEASAYGSGITRTLSDLHRLNADLHLFEGADLSLSPTSDNESIS